MESKYTKYLRTVQKILHQEKADVYLFFNADYHSVHHEPGVQRQVEMLTGFTGDSAVAVVTHDKGVLWADRADSAKVKKQQPAGWEVRIQKSYGILGMVDEIVEWFRANVRGEADELPSLRSRQCLVLFDPTTTPAAAVTALEGSGLLEMGAFEEDILETEVLPKRKKAVPKSKPSPIFPLQSQAGGQSTFEKLSLVTGALEDAGLQNYLLTNIDDITWMFNLRCTGYVPNSCAFRSVGYFDRGVLADGRARWVLYLFSDLYEDMRADPKSPLWDVFPAMMPHMRAHLADTMIVAFVPYERFFPDWTHMFKPVSAAKPFGYSPETTDEVMHAFIEKQREAHNPRRGTFGPDDFFVCLPSPATYYRNRKMMDELHGFRHCHRADGVAVVKFLSWLERQVETGKKVTEAAAAEHLQGLRSGARGYIQPAMDTVSASGANTSDMDHTPGDSLIHPNSLYVLRTAAHYTTGTTPIARTVFIGSGKPTPKQREVYTRAVQGLIAAQTVQYPAICANTVCGVLDHVARQPLAAHKPEALGYGHDTAYGIGKCINAREGPMGIRPYSALSVPKAIPEKFHEFYRKYSDASLRPGVTLYVNTSCAYNEDGETFGVQMGNMCSVEPINFEPNDNHARVTARTTEEYEALLKKMEACSVSVPKSAGGKAEGITSQKGVEPDPIYEVRRLALVPFCKKLIDISMLTAAEKNWIKEYNVWVADAVGYYLHSEGATKELRWLKEACSGFERY